MDIFDALEPYFDQLDEALDELMDSAWEDVGELDFAVADPVEESSLTFLAMGMAQLDGEQSHRTPDHRSPEPLIIDAEFGDGAEACNDEQA